MDRALLWRTLLHELGIPPPLVAQLQHLYHDISVTIAGDTTLGAIPVRIGLKQGCPASPLLFSLLFDRVAAALREAAASLPSPHTHFFTFLTLQLLLLLFADDVALIARSHQGLAALYAAFREFCQANAMTISVAKSKLMTTDPAAPPTYTVAGDTFERVPLFRYLGVPVDPAGNPETVGKAALERSRGSLGALCAFVGTQRWTVPWTRLVLLDVYVRTQMTFAAAVWTPHYLAVPVLSYGRDPLARLAAEYRRGLRALTSIEASTRCTVLYATTLRWPLETVVAKATWRYFHRITGTGAPAPITTVARWARVQDTPERYTVCRGIALAASFTSATEIYSSYIRVIRADIAQSARLSQPAL